MKDAATTPRWVKQTIWALLDSSLELHPGLLGDWYVVEGSRPGINLAGPFLGLDEAKAAGVAVDGTVPDV